MKYRVITFLSILLSLNIFVSAQQQEIEFTDRSQTVIDDTLFIQVSQGYSEADAYVYLRSLSTSLEQLNVSVQISPMEGFDIVPISICVNTCKEGAFSEPFIIGSNERKEVHFEVETSNMSPLSGVVEFIVTKDDSEGATESRFVKFVNSASLATIAKQAKVSMEVYPNPASNIAVFQYKTGNTAQSASIVIRDMVGKVVRKINLETMGTSQKKVSISDLNPGVYFYSYVLDGNIISTKKLIVRR